MRRFYFSILIVLCGSFSLKAQTTCLVPQNLRVTSIAATSVEIAWGSSGAKWDIEYGLASFTQGNGTLRNTGANPYTISGLTPITTYKVYVRRADCPGSPSSSEWSDPLEFTTSCSPFSSPADLPIEEGFESARRATFQRNQDVLCFSGSGYKWSYETSVADTGRLRFGVLNFSNSGSKAATLDRLGSLGSSETDVINYLILTADLRNYAASTDLELSFSYMHHDDASHSNDKVWIRASETDNWLEIYDLSENQVKAGVYKEVRGLDIDALLAQSSPTQTITSASGFQVRFGQEGESSIISRTGDAGYSFDDVAIKEESCPFPKDLEAMNVTTNSVELSWTGGASNWDIEYGTEGFTPGIGDGTPISATISPPYILSAVLKPITTYEVYVRDNCLSPSKQSEWSDPASFTTSCPSLSVASLPIEEGFESVPVATFQQSQDVLCFPGVGYKWSYETDAKDISRLRFGASDFSKSGSKAATLDKSIKSSNVVTNYLILTADLTNYTSSTDLELSFSYLHHGEDSNPNDKVWVRGSEANSWLEIYNLSTNQASAGVYKEVRGIDIDSIIGYVGHFPRQAISSTFQLRFGQQDTGVAVSKTGHSGYSFDDIAIKEVACPFPRGLRATNVTDSSAELSWTTGGASKWEIEYGTEGFTPGGAGTLVSTTASSHSLSGLDEFTAYEVYVRDSCSSSGEVSEWSVPVSFTTLCNPLSAIELPFVEDFTQAGERTNILSFQRDGNVFCSSGYKWNYETSETGIGRLRFGTLAGFPSTVEYRAATLDKSMSSGNVVTNYLILTADLSNYVDSTELELDFKYVNHGESVHPNDAVWIRGSDIDNWIEIHSLGGKAGVYHRARGLDIDALLDGVGRKVSATFQLRFGQQDTGIAVSKTGHSGYSFDNIVIDQVACSFPKVLEETNITANSVELSWTPGKASTSSWDIEYGFADSPQGTRTRISVFANPYVLGGLVPTRTYEFYVRDNCSSSSSSEWSDTSSFITPCSSLSAASLPIREDFESASGTFQQNQDVLCSPEYKWSYERLGDKGQLRFSNFSNSGNVAVTLDKSISSGDVATNLLILTADLRNYAASTNLELSFSYMHHGESSHPNDKVWIRGSERDVWVEVYNLGTNQGKAGMYKRVRGLDIDAILKNNSNQAVSATFQLRFGQQDTGVAKNLKEESGYSFDDIVIDVEDCPFPKNLAITNITANSAELSWTPGSTSTSKWEFEYGPVGFILGSGTQVSTTANPHTLGSLVPIRTYEVYVRDNCSSSSKSEWSDPISFTTSCPALFAIALPINEDFESVSSSTFQRDQDVLCSPKGYKWSYETSMADTGRLRFGVSGFSGAGSSAVTLDKSINSGDVVTNLLILTADLRNYAASTDLELNFSYMHHGEGSHPNDKVWIRGSETDTWVEVYNLSTNQGKAGMYKRVRGLDIDAILKNNSNQAVSATFQLRFGQQDTGVAVNETGHSGYSFDDIVIDVEDCPFPKNLAITNITADSAELSWTPGSVSTSEWEFEYGPVGFTLGSGRGDTTTTKPYHLKRLNGATAYEVYVRDNCSSSSKSEWSDPIRFATPCSPLSPIAVPIASSPIVEEDFESAPVGAFQRGQDVLCSSGYRWSYETSAADTGRLRFGVSAFSKSGSSAATLDKSIFSGDTIANFLILTANLNNFTSSTDLELSFSYLHHGEEDSLSNDKVWVQGSETSAWVEIYDLSANQASPGVYKYVKGLDIDILVSVTSTFQLRFGQQDTGVAISRTGYGGYSFDDIVIKEVDCPFPTGLTAGGATANSVELSWVTGGASNWNIEYGIAGFTQGSGTLVRTTANPYTLSVRGLLYGTTYEVYVRDSCLLGSVSDWTGPVSFAIPCGPLSLLPSSVGAKNIKASEAELSWTVGSTLNWQVEYGIAGFTQGSGTLVHTTTNPHILTGLIAGTDYEFYIRDSCDASNKGSWVGPHAFTTLTGCQAPSSLEVDDITQTTARVFWQRGGSPSDWDIEYDVAGFALNSGKRISTKTNPHTLNIASLTPNTVYEVYVRDNCKALGYDVSDWIGPVSFITLCAPLSTATLPIREDFESVVWDTVQQDQDVLCSAGYKWSYETSMADTGRLRFGVSAFSKSGKLAATLDKSIFSSDMVVNYLTLTADLSDYVDSTDLELSFNYLHHGGNSHSNDKVWIRGSDTANWVETYDLSKNQASAGIYKYVRSLDIDAILASLFPIQKISSTFQVRFGQQDTGVAIGLKEHSGYSFDDIAIEEVPCPFPTVSTTNITSNSVELSLTTGVVTASIWDIEYGGPGFVPGSGTRVSTAINLYVIGGLTQATAYDVYVRHDCPSSVSGFSEWSDPASFTTPCSPLSPVILPIREDFESASGTFQRGGDVLCSAGYKWSYETDAKDISRLRFGEPIFSNSGISAATLDKSISSDDAVTNYLILTADLTNYSPSTDLELRFSYMHHGEDDHLRDKVWIRGSETGTWLEIYDLGLNRTSAGVYKHVRGLDIDALLAIGLPSQAASSTFQVRFGQQDTGVAISRTEHSGYSFDDVAIEQIPCPFPKKFEATNVTANSAKLSWVTGGASIWDIEYGLAGFTPGSGSGTRISAIISSHTLGLLQENTAYDVYVRDSCSSSSVSEWSDPVSFVTPCSPLSAVTLPINEDFESASGTFQRERDVLCFAGYKWSYETSAADTGRLRFGVSGFSNSGRSAATLDKSIPSGDTIVNYLTLTADLTNYVSSTDLELRFSYMHHGEDDHLNDKVWIRGSETDTWIEIYDLGLNRASAGIYKHVRGLDIDDLLSRQVVSSTFQFRFGQQDTGVAIKLGEQSGYSFDDIIIEEISCPFPTGLEVTYLVSDSVELSWVTGGASTWEIEYGLAGFTLGSGTRISTTDNPDTLASLQENTDYEAYVRDSCSSSDVSEWSDPVSFTTPCSPLSPITLPLEEDFESLFGTFQRNREVFCSSGYKWNYETSAADTGRLRFRVSAFSNSGISAATLDKSISNSDTVANYLILTADLSTYASSADLELKFSYMHHEKDDSLSNNNKVWIRGSEAGAWVEIYDLSVNQANAGVYKHVKGLDIDALLADVRPSQAISSTFQLRFVQECTGVAIRLREESGYSLDDIIIDEVSCPFPTGLSATNITAMSVDLSWTTGGANNWDVEYGIRGFTLGTGTRINNPANPHILSGLTLGTDYEFYVRDSCGAGDFSVWEGPHTFRTLSCLAPSSLRASGTTLTIATLSWTTGGANNWDLEYGIRGFTLGTGTRISTLANPYAVSGLAFGHSYEFYVRDSCGAGDVSVWKGPHAFSVLSCPAPSSLRASNIAPTITALSWVTGGANSWELEYGIVGFALGSGTRIGVTTNFYAVSGLTSGQPYEFYVRDSCGVGDVSKWVGPQAFRTLSCPDPSFLSARGITQTTAALSWMTGGASEWELEYGVAGFARGTGTRINNPANPYILSGLTLGTDYEFYVWDSCGVGNVSKWVGPQAFRTLSCPDPSSLSAGGITQTTAALSWMTGGASEWELEYGVAGFARGTGTRINNPANPYILSGLTPGTDYEFYVWDSCGVGNVSKWVGPQAFRTLSCPDPSSLSAGGITQTTATLSWMTGGASEWELEYGVAGFVPDSGTRISTTANPYILSGLTPRTDYEFYVRDSCGIGNVSKWVGPQAFRTLICPAPSSLMPIGITPTTVTLSWMTGGASEWELEYGVAGFSLGTGTQISTTLRSYGVSGLAYGQSYDFYVRDNCDVGNVSKWVGPQTVTLSCPAPSSLSVSNITQTTATLSWVTGGANNWDLEYGSPGFIPGTGIQISTIFNSYVVSGLTHGQLYDFYVRDSCDVGNVSKWVGPQTIALICPVPSSLSASNITQTTVDLSWITGGANNWELEYGSPGFVPGMGTRTSTTANPYSVSGLVPGQSYDLYVRDNCDVGNVSKWMGPQNFTTLICPAPSSLSASNITQTTVDLSWMTGGASEWGLEYGLAGFVPGTGIFVYNATNSYSVSGLVPGTAYDFYVRDSCDVGNVSKWVGPQAFRTLSCPAPSSLTSPHITPTMITLLWVTTSGANNWDLEYGIRGFSLGTGTRISTTANPYSVSGLVPGTAYDFYVRDSCGISNVSRWEGPETFVTLCPAPSSLSASYITPTIATLSWVIGGANNWDLEYGIRGFSLGTGTRTSTTANPYSVSGLVLGTAYDFYVRDSCGVGNVSRWIGPETFGCPAPSSLSASNITQTIATLSWVTGGANNWGLEYGIRGFSLGTGTFVYNVSTNPYSVSGLTSGVAYDFYVRDSCGVGNVSKWIGPESFATLSCPAPSSLPASHITQTTATLSRVTGGASNWDLEYGIRGFSLGTGTFVYNVSTNSYSVSGLTSGVAYDFYVRDSCGVGNVSKWIGPESFATLSCPAPSSLSASHITQTTATLSWVTGGASNWDLEYGIKGFSLGTGIFVYNVSTNSYSVSGLMTNTAYDFYVRDSCGVRNVSKWIGPQSFRTLICPTPSSLSASHITQITATLSWVTGGASNWDLEYGIKGFSLGMGTFVYNVSTNSYSVSGLMTNTAYDFYVRDSCGVRNVSKWIGPQSFRTLSCPAPSSLSASHITQTTTTVSWVTGGASEWDLEYGIKGFSLGTGTRISTTTNSYFVSGLMTNRAYDFYVRDSCGVRNVSKWIGPQSFRTLSCPAPSSLSASNITQTTATLSWVAGVGVGAVSWDLEYGIRGFSLGTGTRISTTTNSYSVSGLVTNTAYEFYVRNNCGVGNVSKWIGPQSFRTLICPVPSSLSASNITQTRATLLWVTGGANNWDLEYGIKGFSFGTGTRIKTTINSYSVSGLVTNTAYEFYVRDSCGVRNVSKWIGPQSFRTLICPVPSSLSASNITQTRATLSWVTGGANNWDLEYGIGGFSLGTGTRIKTTINSYSVSGLVTNTAYEFYVRDSCGVGNVSKWIGPQSFRTLSCPAPSSLSASNITQTRATLSWVTGGANNWDLEYGIGGFSLGTGTRIKTTTNSYSVSGLVTNTAYEFYVRDSCGVGNVSRWIGPQSFRTLSCPAPSSLSASRITQTTATLSWVTGGANNWDLEYGIRGFSLGTGTRIKTTTNSYSVSGLMTNTAYDFYVRDSCGVGNVSRWIGPQNFATLSCPAPSSLSASRITQTTATLSWVTGGAISWDLEYGIGGFSPGTGTRIKTTTNSYSVSGLVPGQSYDFYVRDSCVGSVSRWIGPQSFRTLICPAPSSLSASHITQTTATLSWVAGVGVGAISWDLEYGIRGFSPGTGIFIYNVSTNSYSVSSLIPNTAYDFYVRNNCGVSNVSGWIGPETFKTARCSAPSSLMTSGITQTTATLSWVIGGANNWDLEYGIRGFSLGMGTRVSTTVNPYAVSSLTPGTAYDFYVRDSCAVGNASNWVGPHAFGTLSCPTPSSLMVGGITQTRATLSWVTGGANNWDLEYGIGGFSLGTGTRISTTTNSYAVSGLVINTAYDFYVRDSCGVDNLSNWVGPQSFGTLSCPAPSSLMAGGITQTTATLSWITGGANNWDLEYGIRGFSLGMGTRVSTTVNPYAVSSLTPDTAYEFYVRDSCGVNNLSVWIGPEDFATLGCSAPSSLMASGITHTTATLSWITGGANNWDLEYGIRGFSLGTGTRVSTTVNPYAVSSLTPDTAYEFYVRDSCGVNNLSVWIGPEDFATLGCLAPSSLRYVADTITSSAEISWNSGGASNWNLEYGSSGFTPSTGTFVYNVLNPHILRGLSKGDDYDVYVQDSCAAGNISSWSGPLEIRSFQVDELLERSLRIYPNPSDGIFNIEFNSTFDKDIRIQVINMLGQLILEDELENFSRKSLDMGAHSRGVYILKLITEGAVVNRRITLQ